MGKLDTNLMLASGQQFDRQQRQHFGTFTCSLPRFDLVKQLVVQLGQFCSRRFRTRDNHAPSLIVFDYPVLQLPGRCGRRAGDDGKVTFVDRSFSELLVQAAGRFTCSSKNDRTGNPRVDSTDDAQVDVSGLGIFFLQISFTIGYQAGLVRRNAHGRQYCGLVYDQQVIIFVQNVEVGFHFILRSLVAVRIKVRFDYVEFKLKVSN